MSKKPLKKKPRTAKKSSLRAKKRKPQRYTAGEIALAVLGAAILIMIAGIIITSILE